MFIYDLSVTPGFESAMAHEASRVEQQFGMHRFQVSGFRSESV
jgi:hypothetical protein